MISAANSAPHAAGAPMSGVNVKALVAAYNAMNEGASGSRIFEYNSKKVGAIYSAAGDEKFPQLSSTHVRHWLSRSTSESRISFSGTIL